jgi:hypothetical protein
MTLRPVTGLKIALALVIGYAAVQLLLSAHRGALHAGVHPAIPTVLAVLEILAVILFLIPKTLVLGGRLLWAILAAAALLHLHGGGVPPPIFLVYAAAIWVVLAETRRPAKAAP